MKVLLTTSIFPPEIGGPATYVPMLAQGLHERSHSINVLALSDSRNVHVHDDYPFEVTRIDRSGRIRRTMSLVKEMNRLVRNADVVYGNSTSMLEPALVALAHNKPYALKVVGDGAWEASTRRGWTTLSFEDFQKTRLSPRIETLKRLRSWHVKKAVRVVTPSQFLTNAVLDWGINKKRIETIVNAVSPTCDLEPADLPIKSKPMLISVGRLVQWKNVDVVIECLPSLRDTGLVIVGDGPERLHLESLARSIGVSNRVYFAGIRSRQETMALMKACDVFVLNSSYEGLPHTVAEAMTLGLAIVTTGAGGTMEVVRHGETALVAAPNHDCLTTTLGQVLMDSDLRCKLGNRARVVANEIFSQKRTVDRTEELLSACI